MPRALVRGPSLRQSPSDFRGGRVVSGDTPSLSVRQHLSREDIKNISEVRERETFLRCSLGLCPSSQAKLWCYLGQPGPLSDPICKPREVVEVFSGPFSSDIL